MKKPKLKYQIQYRHPGMWVNGNSYDSKEEAEKYAKSTGRDYQIVKVKQR